MKLFAGLMALASAQEDQGADRGIYGKFQINGIIIIYFYF